MLFIIVKLLFVIISKVVTKLHKIKTIGAIDRILGLALGLIESAICIQILCAVIGWLPLTIAQEASVYIGQSGFIEIVNKINLLGLLSDALSEANVSEFVKGFLQFC